MKKALVLGVTGQDGSYAAESLLEKGYEIHGLIRRSATGNRKNIEHFAERVNLHAGDLADATSLYRAIGSIKPDELYNFADQDHVRWSTETPDYSSEITGAAVGRILEIIKQISPRTRMLQPISSNVFGLAAENPQREETLLNPQSPYACAKAYALHLARFHRNVNGLFVSTAIFYNHESPRRIDDYVTRKITRGVAGILKGKQEKIILGDIDLGIDFGFAGDYVEASQEILKLDRPDDFIICTGELHTVREFLEEAFRCVGIDISWQGEGLNESGYDRKTGVKRVEFSPKFYRPGRTSPLCGDNSKARRIFGFNPKVKFKDLVSLMVNHDLKEISARYADG